MLKSTAFNILLFLSCIANANIVYVNNTKNTDPYEWKAIRHKLYRIATTNPAAFNEYEIQSNKAHYTLILEDHIRKLRNKIADHHARMFLGSFLLGASTLAYLNRCAEENKLIPLTDNKASVYSVFAFFGAVGIYVSNFLKSEGQRRLERDEKILRLLN